MTQHSDEIGTVIIVEQVLVRCPACGWESVAVMVDPERVNGRWFAFSEAASCYRAHFDFEHRPAPEMVVLPAPLSGSSKAVES